MGAEEGDPDRSSGAHQDRHDTDQHGRRQPPESDQATATNIAWTRLHPNEPMQGNESVRGQVIPVLGTNGPQEGIVGKNYVDIENDRGESLRYRKHSNGRGLIAHGAKVHPSAIVEAGAYVEPGVQIAAGAHVGRGVWVESDAVIGPEADIAPHAHIGSGAAIGAGAKIGVRTHVGTGARVAVGSLIGDDETIGDGERVATDRRGLRLAA
jgi:NDP-sugar pyrophosphorylase family protein